MNKTLLVALLVLAASLAPAQVGAQNNLSANAGPDKTLNTGESTTFDGTASSGSIAQYLWDFGDGTSASGATVSKTYSNAGTYTVTLVLLGNQGSTSAPDTATVIVRTSDSTAPNVTHTPPTGTILPGSSVSVTATVTDNIGVGTVSLYYKAGTAATYNSSTMSCTGSATNKSCSGTIPSSVTGASTVNYYVRAQDTRTPTANVLTWPANAPTANVTLALSDNVGPTVTHTAPTRATASQDLDIRVNITDNVGVTGATLYYLFAADDAGLAAATLSEASSSRTMTQASGTATNGTWNASVPLASAGSSVRYVRYFIKASDAASNNGTGPATAPIANFTVGVAAASAPTITHTAVTSATAGQAVTISANVSLTSGSVQNVTLWYNNTGGTVFTAIDMPGTGSALTTVNTTTVPADVVGDRGFRYYVRAYNNAGDSTDSPSGGPNAPITVLTPPGQVTGLAATRATGEVLTLSWTALAGTALSSVASYKIYRSTDGVTFASIGTTTATTHADTTATLGVQYHYRVSAVDLFGAEGVLSSTATLGRRPDVPTDLAAAPSAPGNLSVTWSTKTGAAWYVLEASVNGGAYGVVANTTTGAATIGNLTNGATVTLRVSSYASFAETQGASSIVTAMPIDVALKPTGVTAARQSGGGILVSWTSAGTTAAPSTSFVVQRSTTSALTGFTDVATATGTTLTDASPPTGSVWYRVIGVNALGRAGQSDAALATDATSNTGGNTGGGSTGGTTTPTTATPTPTSATPTPSSATPAPTSSTPTPTSATPTPTSATPTPTGATPTPTGATPAPSPTAGTPTPSPSPTTGTPTPTPTPTPEDEDDDTPGFEVVSLVLAAMAGVYVLGRRRKD